MENIPLISTLEGIKFTKYVVFPNEGESPYLLYERISENMDTLVQKYPDMTVQVDLGNDDIIMVKTIKLNASAN